MGFPTLPDLASHFLRPKSPLGLGDVSLQVGSFYGPRDPELASTAFAFPPLLGASWNEGFFSMKKLSGSRFPAVLI